MEANVLIVLAAGLVAFAVVSGRLQRSVLTPPTVFVAFGFAVSQHGLGLITIDVEGGVAHLIAELTLVLVLFTDASRIDLQLLRREHDLPVRMLLLGLPLTIAAGTGAAFLLFPGLGLWPAALLASILAPTDAALGQAVVSDRRVPVRIRQALNVESGLNDGIALPLVLVFLSTCHATAGHTEQGGGYWLRFATLQVTLGPLVGVAVGWIGGKLVDWGRRSEWMSETFQSLSALGLSFLAFAGAELVGGNGFLAAFCAGLTVGNVTRHMCTRLYEFGEAEGQLLSLLVFFGFGAVLMPEAWVALREPGIGARALAYGVLSLTLVRLVPVALSLLGKKLRWETVTFLGWFGPRGIASILFALVVIEESADGAFTTVVAVVMATVLLSVLAHGVTAYPGAGWYAGRLAPHKETEAGEHRGVGEMPVRIRHR